jgi:hypothetical protein
VVGAITCRRDLMGDLECPPDEMPWEEWCAVVESTFREEDRSRLLRVYLDLRNLADEASRGTDVTAEEWAFYVDQLGTAVGALVTSTARGTSE